MSGRLLVPLSLGLLASGCHSSLYKAADRGDAAALVARLEQSPRAEPGELDRALVAAARNGHVEALKALLARGVRPDGQSGRGEALHAATGKGHLEAAKVLLEAGANVEARDRFGMTSLMWVAWSNRTPIVELLLDAGADPNAVDPGNGQSALRYAVDGGAYHGRIDAVRPLFDAGANPYHKAHDGGTPLSRAEMYVSEGGKVARLLESVVEILEGTPLGREESASEKAAFQRILQRYRGRSAEPLPEEARKLRVQAEAAVSRKRFGDAAQLYREAIALAPWWADGYYNRALVLGESGAYRRAIAEMRRYLALAPDATDARAAQDKVYEWEGELRAARSTRAGLAPE